MKNILFLLIFLLAVQTYAQETIEKKPDTAEVVYDLVEKRADFPGGINEFRTQVMKNFNSKKLRMNKGMIRTKVTFIVERDGSMSDIKAIGEVQAFNGEAIKAVTKIKTLWKPATINGVLVRCRFAMPLVMVFE
ncbi:energy transducer TonB [Chryseobacterium koreense]